MLLRRVTGQIAEDMLIAVGALFLDGPEIEVGNVAV